MQGQLAGCNSSLALLLLTLMSAADISSDMPASAIMKPAVLVAPCEHFTNGLQIGALHTTTWWHRARMPQALLIDAAGATVT